MTVRQMEGGITPGADILQGLEGWRGGNQNDRDTGEMAPQHRHVTRLIGDAVLLLVGLLMLLIDDDKAEVGIRQEQGRARADDDAGLAADDGAPGAAPL